MQFFTLILPIEVNKGGIKYQTGYNIIDVYECFSLTKENQHLIAFHVLNSVNLKSFRIIMVHLHRHMYTFIFLNHVLGLCRQMPLGIRIYTHWKQTTLTL